MADKELLVEYAGPGGRFSVPNADGGWDNYDLNEVRPMSEATYTRLTSDPDHAGHRWAVHDPEALKAAAEAAQAEPSAPASPAPRGAAPSPTESTVQAPAGETTAPSA